MIIKTFYILFFYLLISSCGFKVVEQNYLDDYKFNQVNITGDKRISYLIRNKIKVVNQNASKAIDVNVSTTKNRQIKEKNIQNEITKYQITIIANVDFKVLGSNKSNSFSISKGGDINVDERYSVTLSNEKKLVKDLVNKISDQILKNLKSKLNDL